MSRCLEIGVGATGQELGLPQRAPLLQPMAGRGEPLPPTAAPEHSGEEPAGTQGPEQAGCSQNTGLKEGDCLFQTHLCPARGLQTSGTGDPHPLPAPSEL